MRIVRTSRYLRDLKKLKASAGDVADMERTLAIQPLAGAMIQGLRGVRKVRFRIGNRGKSGGGRAIYYAMTGDGVIVMIAAYAKAEKEELSPDDRKAILRVLEELKKP
ncbi:MAG: type II toxin-antitoxin system RelE/ParE family toxin [Rhizomicrobium sp.]